MTQVKDLIAQAALVLTPTSSTAQLDAEILLAHVLEKNRTWLKTWPDAEPTVSDRDAFSALLARRQQGEPIAYLVGRQPFWSLDLIVTPATLIPRPETELIVEKVLELKSDHDALTVLDLGTGTGAIALAIASEQSNWQVFACDKSLEALNVAKENWRQCGLPVTFVQSDWLSAYENQQFDVIVSNPPYIEADDPHLSQGDVRFEPMTALASGEDGLDDIRTITSRAKDHLNDGGLLMFEHGYNQGPAVRQILSGAGFSKVETCVDLSGHDRVTFGCYYPFEGMPAC